jgi:hypothetical protein
LSLLGISAATGEGISGLQAALWSALEKARAAEVAGKGAFSDSKMRCGIARGRGI